MVELEARFGASIKELSSGPVVIIVGTPELKFKARSIVYRDDVVAQPGA